METLTVVFASLFVAQTVIFMILYRRAVTRHGITRPESPKTERSPLTHDEGGHVETALREELHSSAVAALRVIDERGSVMSSDVSRALNLSREHTSRLMKTLYVKGLVKREGKPFRYTLTEKGRNVLSSAERKLQTSDVVEKN